MAGSIRVLKGALPEDLRLGYGGLVLDVDLARGRNIGFRSSLLLGAGNAQVHAQPIGNQLGSDNFFVVEPRVGIRVPSNRRLRAELGAGYRIVKGVQDLPRLSGSDLRGWTVTMSISFGGFR
jgi:hypothetical protein